MSCSLLDIYKIKCCLHLKISKSLCTMKEVHIWRDVSGTSGQQDYVALEGFLNPRDELKTVFQILISKEITYRSCYNVDFAVKCSTTEVYPHYSVDFESLGLRWVLRFCISNKLQDDVKVAGQQTTHWVIRSGSQSHTHIRITWGVFNKMMLGSHFWKRLISLV